MAGVKIGGIELITKTVLYYLHERVWFDIRFEQTHKRHLFKTITWRIVGSVDTFILAWIVTGNPFSGFKISVAEVTTKMVLYYIHEEVWYKVNFGLEKFRGKNIKSESVLEKEKMIGRDINE